MSRSGRALLSVLALAGSTLAGAAEATAHPDGPEPPAVTVLSTVDSGPPLTVVDPYGTVTTDELPIVAGNTRPTVVIESPADGGVSEAGEQLSFRLEVTDPEDGAVDCTKAVVTHGSQTVAPGPDCTGVLTREAGQPFTAQYADAGTPSLTGTAEVVLNPRAYEAPGFVLPHVNLAGVHHLSAQFAGGPLTVHADSPEGPVVATFADVPATSQWLAADVLDPGGVHDLYLVGPAVVNSVRFQTVPTVAVPPTDGWHTTDVPISVGTAPLWDPQVSLDGGVTWVPAPVVLSAEGVHDVRVRAVDPAGRTSQPAATTVRIDKTAPVTALPTRSYAHLDELDVAVTDAGSGPAAVAVTLDGVPAPVELWRFPAGAHTVTVTAKDAAGNTSTQTTGIEITTSLAELTPLLALRGVPFVKALVMRLQLMAAEGALESGRDGQAAAWVRAFLRSATQLRDPATRDTFTADATFVLGQLGRG
jgi:hypothetical protein